MKIGIVPCLAIGLVLAMPGTANAGEIPWQFQVDPDRSFEFTIQITTWEDSFWYGAQNITTFSAGTVTLTALEASRYEEEFNRQNAAGNIRIKLIAFASPNGSR
jgi:hypothetical protein